MDTKEPQHCWEFHNCPPEKKDNCIAYMHPDEPCWFIASDLKKDGCRKALGRGMLFCRSNCEWFKMKNPQLFTIK